MESVADKLDPGSPTQPQPFGKYLLLGLIARGGMAEVYRARSRQTDGRLYAIKCMRSQLAKEARFVEMFVREGKLAVLLDHTNIVRTFEIGRIEGRYFITMEYIGGKDLTQILRRCQETGSRISLPAACYIAAKMCEGLHHAHTLLDTDGKPLAIVNRDVSPSNVRIGWDGSVKLLDFGIAQAMVKFTSEIGVLKGKFSYMSPEQIRGMPVDARTDVFSTGIILHEMLTTEKLFRGDTEFQLMERVRNVEALPPSKFNRRVPEALDKIVMKALARDVVERYATAHDLAQDLFAFLAPYRFSEKEIVEQLKSLFRAEHDQEMQVVASCQQAELPTAGDRDASLVMTAAAIDNVVGGKGGVQLRAQRPSDEKLVKWVSDSEPGAKPSASDEAPSAVSQEAPTQSNPTPTGPTTSPGGQKGLWARLRNRFGKGE
ncbi:MAG TPA: serine/threonine-protein kinase [Pseudomonadota bacterium]|nr:serine/threonine-protein kinase [Pseudomonadota bacterium]